MIILIGRIFVHIYIETGAATTTTVTTTATTSTTNNIVARILLLILQLIQLNIYKECK
jgi:hypothetical protein